MSAPSDERSADAAQRAAYWGLPLARAIPAAVLAAVTTFSTGHTAAFGLLAFAAFAIVTGVIVAGLSWARLRGVAARPYQVAQGLVSVILGALALVLAGGGLAMFFLVVTAWAAITGALELYSGLRARGRFVAAGDWIAAGAITMVAAVVFVLLPPDIADTVTTADGVTGILDSAVVAVGLLGAYGAIIVVFLAIAGFSAKWGTRAAAAATDPKDVA